MTYRVLLVEDDVDLATSLKVYFTQKGFEILHATGSQEAKEYLTDPTIDLAIFDVVLGEEEDGLSLLSYAKALRNNLPVIMMSGFGTLTMEYQTRKLEGVRFFHKPLPLKVLLNLMEYLVGRKNAPKASPPRGWLSDTQAEKLKTAYLQGSEEALDYLVLGYRPFILSLAQKTYGFSPEDAEDLFQEVSLTLTLKISRIKKIRPFLIGTVHRLCKKWLTRKFKQNHSLPLNIPSPPDQEKKILAQQIWEIAKHHLTKQELALAKAFFQEGLSYQAIQKRFSLPPGSLGPKRMRLIKKMKGLLAHNTFSP